VGLKGNQGTSTGSVEYSPAKAKRMRQRRASEERRWAAMAGPVTVTKVQPHAPGECDLHWGLPGYVDQDGVDCPSCGGIATGLDCFQGGFCQARNFDPGSTCEASWCCHGVLDPDDAELET